MNWIKVSERLPEDHMPVIVYDEYVFVAYRVYKLWYCVCECNESSSLDNVTHWMPLPEPPED